MTDEHPEHLEARANVGQGRKKKRGPTGAFTSLVIVIYCCFIISLVLLYYSRINTFRLPDRSGTYRLKV